MKTEWTTDTYETGNDYDQTRIMAGENEDDFVEMTEAEVNMLVNAVDNPAGKMPTSTHIVTARRISEIISGVWSKIKSALSKKVDKVAGKGLSANDFTNGYKAKLDGLDTALSKKVDKVAGKGLSTNDFTNDLKNKLNAAYDTSHTHGNKTVLDRIDQEDLDRLENAVTRDEAEQIVDDKVGPAVDDAIVAKNLYSKPDDGIPLTDLSEGTQSVINSVQDKVDKVAGKGLSTNDYTDADKDKLDSINLDDYVLVPKPTAANTVLMYDGTNMVWVTVGEEEFENG